MYGRWYKILYDESVWLIGEITERLIFIIDCIKCIISLYCFEFCFAIQLRIFDLSAMTTYLTVQLQ